MDLKPRFTKSLQHTREMSTKILDEFETPEQWTHQVHPKANHALWIVGHLTWAENFFASIIDPSSAIELAGYQEKFGMGSSPTGNPDDYPPAAEVLEQFNERREVLLGVLSNLSEEDLAKSTPDGTPDFLPDFASIFEMAVWHEGIHTGQLTVAHRGIGKAPIFGTPAEAEAS